ncbi:alpha/beta hydrolase [Acinetobacter guillouiae]|uniref:serine aminopeptidase domain-containing protein n=1 Tax=Acinetobacter TaxID=469 RepID=UPI00141ABD7A|nr:MULTISPECIES: alpha/beta hydrolase [Acinetobacter]MCS4297290.1 alpha-beta hydrolase superfamily lysophospholipase [Acinetobacter guillouiae]MCW2250029.1 alpha-beta hydrolase superfamily lysophospholipase [Acinetobacter sp. BIGb0204]NII39133.1 alpha-beta hydrolase superfamily lysophospholipase [Acinetobacter sp. BIGb0196]
MKLNLLTIMLLGSGLFLTACGGSDDKGGNSSTSTNVNADVNNIQNPVVNTPKPYVIDVKGFTLPPNAAESVVMTYKMQGITGKETQATALVFTPKTAPPAEGWPIVAWAHGAAGVADKCAPSKNRLITNSILTGEDKSTYNMIDSFVKDGYVVVAPDYEGLGEPGGQEIHPFLNLKSEAYSITDAVVATKSWLGNKASNKWAVLGHSQGGHAALGTAQYAARANMDYKGAVATAPANNLEMIETLSEMALAEMEGPSLAQALGYAVLDTLTSYMAASMKSVYPTESLYSKIFKSPTDKIAEKAESLCLIDLGLAFFIAMDDYAAENEFSLKGYSSRKKDGFKNDPIVRQFLDKDSQPLQSLIKTPIIIYQGGSDTIVLPQATDALVAQARALTTKIDYRTDPTWDHFSIHTVNVENGQLMEDIKTLLAN